MTGDVNPTPVYQGGGLTPANAQALVNEGLGGYEYMFIDNLE